MVDGLIVQMVDGLIVQMVGGLIVQMVGGLIVQMVLLWRLSLRGDFSVAGFVYAGHPRQQDKNY